MILKKIILSVKRSKFRSDDPTTDEANAEFLNVRKSILERDQYTCQYCDFRDEKYQEIHHIDDNHENNSPENLITACPLCHACHHIGLTGVKGRGDVIYLDPSIKIEQSDLNQLVRALWIAESGDSKDMQRIATEKLSKLYKATVTAKRKIGTADATILGDFLLSLDEEKYADRENFLSGVYILPRLEQYKQQIEFWRTSSFKAIPPSVWSKISKQRIRKWILNETGDASDEEISAFINKEH
jgi:intracellular multiplication protein IcmJ